MPLTGTSAPAPQTGLLARLDFTRPRTVVVAALLVGVLAGLAGAVFHTVATEPRIDDAIAIEEAAAEPADAGDGTDGAAADHAESDEGDVFVSRRDQKGVGLFLAYALTGGVFGLFLAVTSLTLRTTTGGPFGRVVTSGLLLAGAITVAPWLKYPPNPPAVGDPATVGERERLYVLCIVLAALLLAGVARLSGRLRTAGWPDDRRIAAVTVAGLVAFGLLFVLLPTSTVDIGVPANLLWQFRLNSLTGNLLMWTVLTLGLGALWSEATRRAAARQNSMPLSAEMPAS